MAQFEVEFRVRDQRIWIQPVAKAAVSDTFNCYSEQDLGECTLPKYQCSK